MTYLVGTALISLCPIRHHRNHCLFLFSLWNLISHKHMLKLSFLFLFFFFPFFFSFLFSFFFPSFLSFFPFMTNKGAPAATLLEVKQPSDKNHLETSSTRPAVHLLFFPSSNVSEREFQKLEETLISLLFEVNLISS